MPLIPALGDTARQISLSSRPALQSKFQFQDSQDYVSKKKKSELIAFFFTAFTAQCNIRTK